MKVKKLLLLFSLAAFTNVASASIVITFVGPHPGDPTNSAGAAVGPYDFSVNGNKNSIELICDDVGHPINIGDSWNVNIETGNNLAGARFPGGDYRTAFVLFDEIMVAPPSQYADLQQALWHATTPSLAALQNAAQIADFNSAHTAGQALTNSQLAQYLIYTPIDPDHFQEQYSKVPEGKTFALVGLGFVAVSLSRLLKKKEEVIR